MVYGNIRALVEIVCEETFCMSTVTKLDCSACIGKVIPRMYQSLFIKQSKVYVVTRKKSSIKCARMCNF